eukprot:764520-Hanusia_phi.AAC.2
MLRQDPALYPGQARHHLPLLLIRCDSFKQQENSTPVGYCTEVREEPGGDQQAAEAGACEEGDHVSRRGEGEKPDGDPAEHLGGGREEEAN